MGMDNKGKYETVHRKVKIRYEKDMMNNYQPSQELLEKKAKQTIEAERHGKVFILPEGEVDKSCGGERSAGDGGTDVEHGEGGEDKEEQAQRHKQN